MKHELPFDQSPVEPGRPQVGAVLRELDFVTQWKRDGKIPLDLAVWVQEESMEEDAWQPVHMFCSAVCRTSQVAGKDQLACENPQLFQHLSGFSDGDFASFFLGIKRKRPTAEYVGTWLEGVKKLWPDRFGIGWLGCAFYRDENGDFWIVRQQEFKLAAPRPRIFMTEDVTENGLPTIGDVTESFEQLSGKLQSAASERGWQEPRLLAPWHYEINENCGGYVPSATVIVVHSAEKLARLWAVSNQLRLEAEKPPQSFIAAFVLGRPWTNSCIFKEMGWPKVCGVDLRDYDVKGGND